MVTAGAGPRSAIARTIARNDPEMRWTLYCTARRSLPMASASNTTNSSSGRQSAAVEVTAAAAHAQTSRITSTAMSRLDRLDTVPPFPSPQPTGCRRLRRDAALTPRGLHEAVRLAAPALHVDLQLVLRLGTDRLGLLGGLRAHRDEQLLGRAAGAGQLLLRGGPCVREQPVRFGSRCVEHRGSSRLGVADDLGGRALQPSGGTDLLSLGQDPFRLASVSLRAQACAFQRGVGFQSGAFEQLARLGLALVQPGALLDQRPAGVSAGEPLAHELQMPVDL